MLKHFSPRDFKNRPIWSHCTQRSDFQTKNWWLKLNDKKEQKVIQFEKVGESERDGEIDGPGLSKTVLRGKLYTKENASKSIFLTLRLTGLSLTFLAKFDKWECLQYVWLDWTILVTILCDNFIYKNSPNIWWLFSESWRRYFWCFFATYFSNIWSHCCWQQYLRVTW